eukprot:352650-Chlamydomonas_euryale.AAC.1
MDAVSAAMQAATGNCLLNHAGWTKTLTRAGWALSPQPCRRGCTLAMITKARVLMPCVDGQATRKRGACCNTMLQT